MPERKNILALYDCRSKQEYIYRTNIVQEITGASELLRSLFTDFFEDKNNGFKIKSDWKNEKAPENFLDVFNSEGYDAEIVYEGGGNLCVIFKDKETYISVNKALSKQVLEKTFAVSIIASATEVTDNFAEDRKRLYAENALQKNLGAYHTPCNVLPFTQVDRLTYLPVVKKSGNRQYSTESLKKKEKYTSLPRPQEQILEYEFDNMVDKGNESLLAIIYIDGNNMGAKVKAATAGKTDYTSGINALREFSKQTDLDFVERPIKEIKDRLTSLYNNATDDKERRKYLFRKVISGGDEITIVCNAHAVPEILETYFNTLTGNSDNSACAGVAIFHSHDPFADVYEIAEACCEMGKKVSHLKGNEGKNFIDFHYCHSGITNSLETIRETQEKDYTQRPYEYSGAWKTFCKYGKLMAKYSKRSDVKALCTAIVKGDSYYKEELRRMKSRDSKKNLTEIFENEDEIKKIIFDIAIVYDLWFAEKGEDINEQN